MRALLDKLLLDLRVRMAGPPRHEGRFRGPVLVLGSAPTATQPEGFDERFSIISVNGAQAHLRRWGARDPDVTFLTYTQVKSDNPKAVEVRRVLAGRGTGSLHVIRWRKSRRRLVRLLRAIPYGYDRLATLSRYGRMALHDRVMGERNPETSSETRYSNGVTGILFALHYGAEAVVISGIDPNATGHVHGTRDLARQHVAFDAEIIGRLLRRGAPLYTADPGVAERSGIPLWPGHPADRAGTEA